MFTKIGKLLTTHIGNYDLYNFAKRFIAKVSGIIGDNTTIAPYVAAVSDAVKEMKKVFSRNLKNPLTREINRKNRERVNLLIALKRKIGIAQMMIANSSLVGAANNLKREMKDRGWWKYKKLNYGEATAIITSLLDTMVQDPFTEWATAANLQSTLDNLKQTQAEFEVLENERIDEKNNDTTPQMVIARKKLIDVVLAMLAAIDFGVESDPETYAEIADFAVDMIIEFNTKTMTRQALAENVEDEPDNGATEINGETNTEVAVESVTEPEAEETTVQETSEGVTAYE